MNLSTHLFAGWVIGEDLFSLGVLRLEYAPTGSRAVHVTKAIHLLNFFPNREDNDLT
jgi:hypothetical protein